MKTFEDLIFKPHETYIGGAHAVMDFPNGYGISVITGSPYMYCDRDTYEVAVRKDSLLCYDTPITDDVLSYQTEEDVTKIMQTLQEYSKDQY